MRVYFNWCLKYYKKVILLDGQLSENVIDVFSDVRKRQTFVIRNSFTKKNTDQAHHFSRTKRPYQYANIWLRPTRVINDVKNGKNLYIVCNEKTNPLAFKKGFLNFTNNVFCFTGDTPDPEKRNLCINLKENATKYNVFITTSILLAGNSIAKPHFDISVCWW